MKTVLILIDLASIDYLLVPIIEELLKNDRILAIPLVCKHGKSDLLASKGIPFTTDVGIVNRFVETPGKKLFLNAADTDFPAHRLGWSLDNFCRKNNIPSLSVEHSAVSFYRLNKNHIVNADSMALAGFQEFNEYRSLGVSPEKLVITGCPKYDAYYKLSKENSIQDDQNIVNFEDGFGYILLAGVNNAFVDFPFAAGIPERQWVEILGNIYGFLLDKFHLNIVVKPHPAEPELGVDRLYVHAIRPENETRIKVVDPHASLQPAISGSELVLSFSPTVMLESLLLNKPVIMLQGRGGEGTVYRQCEDAGAVFVRREWFDIENALKEDIPQEYYRNLNNISFSKEFIERIVHKWDGKASNRMAFLIEKMMDNEPIRVNNGVMVDWNEDYSIAPLNGNMASQADYSDMFFSDSKPGENSSELKSSIIVVSYNSASDIRACIESIRRNTVNPYEIIVVDNCSADGTREYLETQKDIKVIFNATNNGFSKGCNQGIKASTGEYIIFLNPDTLVTGDWDRRMVSHFKEGVGVVGPVSNYVAGLQKYEFHIKEPITGEIHINDLAEKLYQWNKGKGVETKLLIGFCLMIKKDVIENIGMLDEDLFLGNDDLEFSLRIRNSGFTLLVATDTFIYHKGQASFKTEKKSKTSNLLQQSADKLYDKLEKRYGANNIPTTMELWGLPDWFVRPSQVKTTSNDSLVSNTMSFTGERAMPLAANMDEIIMEEHWARYRLIEPLAEGNRVLDVACGTGYGSDLLAQTATLVTGGDISHETIAYCRTHYHQKENLQFKSFDIRTMPFDEKTFDFVVSFETLEHIVEGDQFLRETCRVLTEDGILAISTPIGGPCGNPYHVAYYQRDSFKEFLCDYFKEVDTQFQRGTQFFPSSLSPSYAPTFTGEYGIAICRKPKKHSKRLTSIIILTHNQLEYTKKCIESIFTHTRESFELIVVDNGSTDGTVEYLEREVRGLRTEDGGRRAEIRVIKNQENLGFAAGNNQGMVAARGDYILLVNNDIVVTPGWLERMISCAENNPKSGIVGPMSNYVAGPQFVENVPYNTETLEGLDDFAAKFADQHTGKTQRFLRVVGFCMLIKKAVIDKIGGMDDRYGLGNFEDDDFSLRAALAGFELWVAEDCFIHHFGGRTFISAKIDYRESLYKTWEIFKEKWGMPKDMPYGSYNVSNILKKGFVPERHFCPLPDAPVSTVYEAAGIPKSDDAIKPRIAFKKKSKTDMVSIIIPVAGNPKYLKTCIANLKTHTPVPHEIILVDNDCGVGKQPCLGKCFNKGMEAASGEFIVLMYDNVMVADGWLNGMLRCIDNAGIVGPMTNAKTAGTQCAAGSDHVKIDQLEKYAGAFLEKNHYRRVPSREVAGFCMLFRRRLVQHLGGFDEALEQGSESDDYCVRAALEGYKNLIAGDVFVLCCDLRPQGNKRSFKHKWRCIDLKSHDGQRMAVLNSITTAERLYQGEDVDKAITTLMDGIQYRMEGEAIYHRLAEMLLGSGRFDEGLEVLKSIPEYKKNSARTFELTGYCKAGLGLYDEAAQCADRARSLNGSSAPALNLMGVLARRKDDNSVSEDFFNKAIASDPGYGQAYTNLGILAWETGCEDDALELLEKGFILASTVEDSITAYRSAISETVAFERAEGIFRAAKALYPLNRRIAFLLIDILIQQEKYESAMQEIRKAMITFGISGGILPAAKAVLDRFYAKKSKNKVEKPVLSLCMIVKNEEDCLLRCLMSVIPVVDEIVIVDTGSTDRTKEIAETFGAKVYDIEWTDDFSEARNISLSKATGKWILVLDADETVSPLDYERLSKIVKRDTDHPAAFTITTRNYVRSTYFVGWMCNDGQYAEEEEGTGWYPSEKVRLFTSDNSIWFENAVHEMVEPSLGRRGIKIGECDIPVHHYGELDTDHYDTRSSAHYLLGKKELGEKGDEDIRTLAQLAIQAQGKLGKYEEAVALWEKVLKIDPGNIKALLNMGYTLLKLKKYEAARASSNMVMGRDPGLKEAVVINTTCEVLLGDSGKTIPILENLLKKVPKYPPAIAILAVVYGMGHERAKGMKHIKYLMKMGFLCADYLHDLAERLIFVGKTDSAISLLEFAVESGNGTREVRELVDSLLIGGNGKGLRKQREMNR